jgi:hypothetical protein
MMVLFRAVLRLHGEKPEGDNVLLAQRVASLAGMDPAPFVRAVRHVRGESRLPASDAGAVLAGYLSGIERLDAYLDRYGASS